jgi:Domain of unknown function (DUF1929)
VKKVAVLAAAVALSPLVLPAPTLAHKVTERQLFRYEVATLGREHALEHAHERKAARIALRRWNAMTPKQQRTLLHRERTARAATASAAPLDRIGQWSDTTIPLPTFAINAVMLPTGKVAFWGRPPLDELGHRANDSQFWLWDPVSGDLVEKDAPEIEIDGKMEPAPIFCSGQSLLADGELFVAGGNLGNPQSLGGKTPLYQGLNTSFTFDPWTETWTRQPDMEHGRWYPSQVELPDGRIAVLAGGDENGNEDDNQELEVFTPSATLGGKGTITHYPAGDRLTAFYPHLFSMPGGNVLLGGPTKPDSGLLDLSKLGDPLNGSAWTNLGRLIVDRVGGNAILWPQNAPGDTRMTLLGGYYFTDQGGDATPDTETFDLASSDEGWQLDADGIPAMHVGRSYGNIVQLPDSTLVAVGGGAGDRDKYGTNFVGSPFDERLKEVELLKPGVDTDWTLGPAQRKFRAYHSTAILLPDGRVLSAGDDYWYLGDEERPGAPHAGESMDVGEIYSPPYLFDGDQLAPRPVIADAPAAVPYGAGFGVAVSNREAGRAVLVAPGATTHGADMNQRIVNLQTIDAAGAGLDVRAPSGPDVAPPGYYMLFVLDKTGTPSVARWVRLGADAPLPSLLPPALASTPTPVPTATPTPTVTPTPVTPRRPQLRLTRHGRRLQLRLTLHGPGRAALDARLAGRRILRTLRFRTAGTRTVKITAPRRPARLTVSVRATAATGHKWTLKDRWRVR